MSEEKDYGYLNEDPFLDEEDQSDQSFTPVKATLTTNMDFLQDPSTLPRLFREAIVDAVMRLTDRTGFLIYSIYLTGDCAAGKISRESGIDLTVVVKEGAGREEASMIRFAAERDDGTQPEIHLKLLKRGEKMKTPEAQEKYEKTRILLWEYIEEEE